MTRGKCIKKYGLCFLASLFMLTSCSVQDLKTLGGTAPESEGNISVEGTGAIVTTVPSMEEIAVLDYRLPYVDAHLLTDLRGYNSNAVKKAYIKGDTDPGTFKVVNAESGEIVCEGAIAPERWTQENAAGEGTAEGILMADFSAVTKDGTYYLECPRLGQSYPFSIDAHFYRREFARREQEMIRQLQELDAPLESVTSGLQAFEYTPEVFRDADGNGTPDYPEAVMQWIVGVDYDSIPENRTMEYVSLLAKFSYLYQNYDLSLATECLQKASSLYSQSTETLQQSSASFRALAELYRASGSASYGALLAEEGRLLMGQSGFLNQTGYLYGAMTYMNTRQSVDLDVCSFLMKELLERGEELGNRRRELAHPVVAKNEGSEELLLSAQQVVCANRVLDGYQYDEMLEEMLHYLAGENLQSFAYDAEGANEGEYLLLYSWMAGLEEKGMIAVRQSEETGADAQREAP